MPSRELLSAVLGYVPFEIKGISSVGGVGKKTLVVLNEDTTVRAYINIYELMHLMKAWSIALGRKLLTDVGFKEEKARCLILHSHRLMDNKWFEAETEFEAVIKACEWILEQTNEP